MRKIYILFFVLFPTILFATQNELNDTLTEITITNQRVNTLQKSYSSPISQFFIKRIEQEKRIAIKDFSAIVPNLYIPDYGSKMTSSIYIRGLGTRIDNPVVGMYIDGIGIANKNGFDADLYDIRSLEVYRGPQGTLFGKNTIGGVFNITTLSPLVYQGTRFSIGYGNGNTIQTRLSHYYKTKNNVGIGASAYFKHTDGFFTNSFNNKKCDWANELGARLKTEWEGSSSNFSNSLIFNWVNQGGFPYHAPNKSINYNDICSYQRINLLEGLNYNFDFEKYQLNGTTSYQFLLDKMNMDQDYQPLSYFTLMQAQNEHVVTQELSLKPKKKTTEGWDWITGLSLSYKHNTMNAPVTFKKDGIDSLILKNANNGIQQEFPTEEIHILENSFIINSKFITQNVDAAIYHTSFYRLKKWQIEAGIRLDFEYSNFSYNSNSDIHYRFTLTQPDFKLLETNIANRQHLMYIEALPKLAISYKEKHWNAYLSVSEGYKGGGFNTQLFSDILQNKMMNNMMEDLGVYFSENNSYEIADIITYKPERCVNTELGFSAKGNINNTYLSIATTLFWIEVFNQQLTIFPTKGTGRLMTNAGRSRSLGAELSANIRYKNLSFDLNYGYTNAKFVKYNNGKSDFAKKYVPYVPQHTLTAAVNYTIPFNHTFFKSIDLNLNSSAFGDIYWNEENSYKQHFYALLAANITLNMKNFSIDLWGKNLTNTKYNTFYFVSMGNSFLQKGKPITFGITLNLNF